MIDKSQMLSGMTTRQKVTAGVFVLVLLVVIWQVYSLFGGSRSVPYVPPATNTAMKDNTPGGAQRTTTPQQMSPQQMTPQQADLPKPAPVTQREAELMQLQQETQAKYLAAINELQMLKISRELAETNQAIMTAKLATVTAEKGIVNLLTPPQPTVAQGAYAKSLVNPATAGGPPTGQVVAPPTQPEITYTVISVSQLEYKWGAVLGYQGNLYSVSVGDVLPPDGSVVSRIDKSGVILEKDGVKKKLSLVPII